MYKDILYIIGTKPNILITINGVYINYESLYGTPLTYTIFHKNYTLISKQKIQTPLRNALINDSWQRHRIFISSNWTRVPSSVLEKKLRQTSSVLKS